MTAQELTPRQQHRGRVALLTHAATVDDIGTKERAALIRLGAPGHDPEHVYIQLRRYTELLQDYQYPAAQKVLEALAEQPPAATLDDPEGAA